MAVGSLWVHDAFLNFRKSSYQFSKGLIILWGTHPTNCSQKRMKYKPESFFVTFPMRSSPGRQSTVVIAHVIPFWWVLHQLPEGHYSRYADESEPYGICYFCRWLITSILYLFLLVIISEVMFLTLTSNSCLGPEATSV